MARATLRLVSAAACAALAACNPLLIELQQGVLRGVEKDGMRVFRGIPYAEPPVGQQGRWRPPQPHHGWSGVLDASDFRSSCVTPQCWVSENLTKTSEDCLFVNVIAPKVSEELRPVFLYFHAGEFHCGTSNDNESKWPIADDVLLVTFNYRVGAFGFLGSNQLRDRDPRGGTGNYGLLDQRMAVQWTKNNIRAFGGDPDKITLIGESSGGSSVAFHLVAYGANPTVFYSRAILESPGLAQVKTLQDAETNYEWLLALLTSRGSPGCERSPGYGYFWAVHLYSILPNMLMAVHHKQSIHAAKEFCDSIPHCVGFTRDSRNETNMFFSVSDSPYPYDVEQFTERSFISTYIKNGPSTKSKRMECLLRADAYLLDLLTGVMPRDDTFATDAWAPVIDGVDLLEPIMLSVAMGRIASGVDLLTGSNLDEGTEFMSLTPPLDCNATRADFEAWVRRFHGKTLEEKVLNFYRPSELERPLPACGVGGSPSDLPGEKAVFYNAAMRSAGDAAIRCPAELVARKASGNTFVYQFTVTPKFTVNFPNTTIMGSFHGAEVPFVFQDRFELLTPAERSTAKDMSCWWRSFAMHGDPSVEDCGDADWKMYKTVGNPIMRIGRQADVSFETPLEKQQCEIFLGGLDPELQREVAHLDPDPRPDDAMLFA